MTEGPNVSEQRVGIEISSSGLTSVVLEENDTIAAVKTLKRDGFENSIDGISKLVQELRAGGHFFSRVGIAIPGLIDLRKERVTFSSHEPGHVNVDLAQEVSAATGVNAVLENDANAAAFGEFSIGAGRGSRDLFYVTLGEGVGGAIILDGKIWRGAAGFAGEFGYVPISSEGKRLQQVASSANIIRRTRDRFHQDNTSSLNRLAEESITLQDIIAAAEREDDFAQMMLERTGRYIGTAIASVINLLNIEKIVIGGEIMQAKHLVLDAIKDRARELSFAPAFQSTEIVEGQLGANAAAIGAALLSGLKETKS